MKSSKIDNISKSNIKMYLEKYDGGKQTHSYSDTPNSLTQ